MTTTDCSTCDGDGLHHGDVVARHCGVDFTLEGFRALARPLNQEARSALGRAYVLEMRACPVCGSHFSVTLRAAGDDAALCRECDGDGEVEVEVTDYDESKDDERRDNGGDDDRVYHDWEDGAAEAEVRRAMEADDV